MPAPSTHRARRDALTSRVPGPILLLGNGIRARNLPMNHLPFRQDSSFLYFTGCAEPQAAALLVDGGFELFLPAPHADDALWHGATASLEARGTRYGADAVHAEEALEGRLRERATGKRIRTLAVADVARNGLAARLCDMPLDYGNDNGDDALIDAVIALRRTKDEGEIAAIEAAAAVTARAFAATMQATRPGASERGLWTLFEALLRIGDEDASYTTGYDTILTQSGEVLHHHGHEETLKAGRLLLLDGGGEGPTGYGVDITRTWPVSGTFTGRQRAAYDAVLQAQQAAIARCTVGTRFRDVHDQACLVLARFLVDEGLAHGEPAGLVETGAHALFFPHGVGHLLGLDVHDLENFGDRPAYPAGRGRPEPFGTRYLRLDLPLEAGWVVTIEPGFYVVPAILDNTELAERFGSQIDLAKARTWVGFGGVRIEDDVLVTGVGPRVLTAAVPSAPGAIEAAVGTGPTAEERLWGR